MRGEKGSYLVAILLLVSFEVRNFNYFVYFRDHY